MTAERHLKLGSDELQIVWGEVYIPNVPDTDGDFMTADGIREMAYKFMKNGGLGNIDIRHNNRVVKGACVVESYIARKDDPDGFIEGSWVAGVHIPDKTVWGSIKKGELNGFSMEALVVKTPVEVELDIPPVLSGTTQKDGEGEEAHEHEFFVSYDEDGNFKGGRTSVEKGHWHPIRRGTVTEEAAGHRHKFAMIDAFVNMGNAQKADLTAASLDDSQGGAGAKATENEEEHYNHHIAGHMKPGRFGSPIRADIFEPTTSARRAFDFGGIMKADIAGTDLATAGLKNPETGLGNAKRRKPKFIRQRAA